MVINGDSLIVIFCSLEGCPRIQEALAPQNRATIIMFPIKPLALSLCVLQCALLGQIHCQTGRHGELVHKSHMFCSFGWHLKRENHDWSWWSYCSVDLGIHYHQYPFFHQTQMVWLLKMTKQSGGPKVIEGLVWVPCLPLGDAARMATSLATAPAA